MNKSKQLYCDLKDELVAYTPGSTFRTVRSIMDKSGLSQTTVCSAIQRLTEEGLLRKNGRRSMEVTDAVLRYRKGAKPVYCLAIPRWPSEYYNMVELCFMEQAERLGYELEIVHYDWKQRVPRELELPKLDGLVVITGVSDITGDDVSFLDALDVPYVIFGRFLPSLALHSVSNDEEYTGAVAAHHLFELGHRKLAVLHSEPEGEGMTARTKGFRQFAELHGCSVEVIECGVRAGDDAVRIYEKALFGERAGVFRAVRAERFDGVRRLSGLPRVRNRDSGATGRGDMRRGVESCLSCSGADFGRDRPSPAGGGGGPHPEGKRSREV